MVGESMMKTTKLPLVMAGLLLALAFAPSASAFAWKQDYTVEIAGGYGDGTQLPAAQCPESPCHCPDYDHASCCEAHPEAAECQRDDQCAANPSGPLCTGDRTICNDGSTGWDRDHDGYCDQDDSDMDGDGVPNSCDQHQTAGDPVDKAYDESYMILFGCP
jgi:hypothetical protein